MLLLYSNLLSIEHKLWESLDQCVSLSLAFIKYWLKLLAMALLSSNLTAMYQINATTRLVTETCIFKVDADDYLDTFLSALLIGYETRNYAVQGD